MRKRFFSPRSLGFSLLALTLLLPGALDPVSAHEGHAALPSTGATVEDNYLLISPEAYQRLGVETGTVTVKDLDRKLRVQAHVELPWFGQAIVTTLVAGRVRSLLVKPGETVRQGQTLAEIESLELGKLQFALLQAREQLDMSRQVLDQQKKLVETGTVARKSLLETEAEIRQHEVQVAIQRRKLRALGLTLAQIDRIQTPDDLVMIIPVVSPINGVISHADVRVGEFVDTEQHLFNIVDRSQLLIVGQVLEADASLVNSGQSVAVHFPALGEKPIPGQISRLRLGLNATKRTMDVVIPVKNEGNLLQPEMSGWMVINVSQTEQAIICPAEALIQTHDRTFVLLRRDEGRFERREVRLGLRSGGQVEVLKGLFPGDQVVVTGTRLLAAMFHTEVNTSSHTATVAKNRSKAKPIPLAQAITELPTGSKGLAVPVVEGRIVSILVEPGQWVKQGTVMAELDSQELRNLQLELLETNVKLQLIRTTIARVTPLVERKTYQKSLLWEHQLEEKTLAYRLEEIKNQLSMIGLPVETIQALLNDSLEDGSTDVDFIKVPVTAPADGWLADFRVVPGEIVHANDTLFELQNPATLWVQAYVYEDQATQVQVGQTAELAFAARPGAKVKGQVIRVSPTLHSDARVLPVWIEIENPDGRFREGMRATGQLLAPVTAPLAQSR